MVQKFRESLQIGVKVNFRDKNFVITLYFRDSMLTRPFFSERAIVAKIYSRTDIFSDPDFKDLSGVTTMPGHQSNKTCRRWDSFQCPRLLTLSTRSANILAHGLYTCSAMRQYIGAGVFTRVSSEAKRTFGVNPFLLSSNKCRPHLSPARKTEGAVLVRHRSRRAVKAKLFLQRRKQAASRFYISREY